MAYTVNWLTKVITIPKSDTTLDDAGPPELRSLAVDDVWTELHLIQESEDGIPNDDIFIRRAQRTLAGVTYAAELEIINGYTLEFDDASGTDAYQVTITGGNHNISDVKVENLVSLVTNNSAGLVVAAGADAVLDEEIETGLTLRQAIAFMFATAAGESDGTLAAPGFYGWGGVGSGVKRVAASVDANGNRTNTYDGTGIGS